MGDRRAAGQTVKTNCKTTHHDCGIRRRLAPREGRGENRRGSEGKAKISALGAHPWEVRRQKDCPIFEYVEVRENERLNYLRRRGFRGAGNKQTKGRVLLCAKASQEGSMVKKGVKMFNERMKRNIGVVKKKKTQNNHSLQRKWKEVRF